MANVIKYSSVKENNTILVNDFLLGVNDVGYGESADTGFYAGYDPPVGGYVIYVYGPAGIQIMAPQNDAELIGLASRQKGSTVSTVADALDYFFSQEDKIVVNRTYENIVTDGLILCLDGGFSGSYPQKGTVWRDISGNGNHVNLYNGISYSNGSLVGDGTSAYGRTANTLNLSNLSAITVISVCKAPTTSTLGLVYEHTSNWNSFNTYTGNVRYGGFGFAINTNGNSTTQNFGHFQLIGNNGQAGANSPLPTTTNLQHYAAVHDFSKSTDETVVYVNGAYTSYSSNPSTGVYGSNNTQTFVNDYLYLWSRGGVTFQNLSISLLCIYNRALSESEISRNFNAIKNRYGL